MKINFFKPAVLSLATALLLTGCVNSDDYSVPANACTEPGLTANKTVASLNSSATTSVTQYTTDDVIEAYVVSSDERGNIFKTVYLQTLPADGTPVGFSLAIDKTSLFSVNFYPGRKVYVKLKDLYYGKVNSSLAIGALYEGTVGRIAEYDYQNYIKPSCSEVSEETLVRTMTLSQALNDSNLNTLIELDGVQFDDSFVGGTYYDENDTANTAGGSTNRALTDFSGNAVQFRTSSYANFSGDIIPGNSGKVRGILTKYGTTYQFLARSADDIKLTEARVDAAPPIVGTSLNLTGPYSENFESYAVNNTVFPTAINDAIIGASYWNVRSFSGNKYLFFSSYNNASSSNRVVFIVPKSATATTLQFKTLAGYSNGDPLKVYYSADYVPGGDVNSATLQDITSNFTISVGPANSYATTFTDSGVYTFTAGEQGFFIFEYIGSDANGITTNMELDNIVVQ